MNVAITEQQESWIQRLIRGGRYNNKSEVIRDALRRMEDTNSGPAPTCAQLAEALEKNGLSSAEAKDYASDLAEYRKRTNARGPSC